MQATNCGAGAENSFGLNINLPHEQEASSYIRDSTHLMEVKYFFTRKLVFIKESHATLLLPGGFGTIDQGFENLTPYSKRGSVCPGPLSYSTIRRMNWDRWLDLLDSLLLENGFTSTEDRLLIKRTRNAEEALNHIKSFYSVFHSLRYVREKTILRLNTPLSPDFLEKLNEEFKDILFKGKIESTGPLKEELKNHEYPKLPRISLHFDKKSFGRLNLLIARINQD
jgi:predicted Rossmann-fold nucleotide-binding protein